MLWGKNKESCACEYIDGFCHDFGKDPLSLLLMGLNYMGLHH